MRLGRAVASVWAALLISALAAGCTGAGRTRDVGGRVARSAPAGQPRPAKQALADEAARVVREYWRARNLAYSALEMGPLRGFEDQAAALLSQAEVDYRLANGLPPDPSSSTSLRDLRTYLTRPGRFPRLLLAAVTAASDDVEPQVYLLTFTRASPQAPWKLSWRARYADNTKLPSVRTDTDGFAVPLSPAQQRATLLAGAVEVGRRLQDYRRRAAQAATPPRSSFFADARDTYGAAKDLQNEIGSAKRMGIDEQLVARPPDFPAMRWRRGKAPWSWSRSARRRCGTTGPPHSSRTRTRSTTTEGSPLAPTGRSCSAPWRRSRSTSRRPPATPVRSWSAAARR